VYLLEGIGSVLVVSDEVDAAEGALTNYVHRFVLLHKEL
jgi:hypothetical protein